MYLKEATFMINGCGTQAQVQGDIGGGGWEGGVEIMVTLKANLYTQVQSIITTRNVID